MNRVFIKTLKARFQLGLLGSLPKLQKPESWLELGLELRLPSSAGFINYHSLTLSTRFLALNFRSKKKVTMRVLSKPSSTKACCGGGVLQVVLPGEQANEQSEGMVCLGELRARRKFETTHLRKVCRQKSVCVFGSASLQKILLKQLIFRSFISIKTSTMKYLTSIFNGF